MECPFYKNCPSQPLSPEKAEEMRLNNARMAAAAISYTPGSSPASKWGEQRKREEEVKRQHQDQVMWWAYMDSE